MSLHKKVQCWILSSDTRQCLLLKTNKARGEFWQPVTGTVEPGEAFFEAACREPLEETGFEFTAPPQDVGYIFDFASRFGPAREHTYVLTVHGTPVPTLDPKEHQSHQWIDARLAPGLLRFPSNVEGLKRSYRLVFGRELGDNS